MAFKDAETIWNGLTDDEKFKFARFCTNNIKCIFVETSRYGITMIVDRYDDLEFNLGDHEEDIDGGPMAWKCICGQEFNDMDWAIGHILMNHLDEIINTDANL